VHSGSALEQARRGRGGREGARCAVEVRWSCDEGAVVVEKGRSLVSNYCELEATPSTIFWAQ